MPDRILYPEFRDEMEFTRYPFVDTASLTADTGLAIDIDAFLDASIYPVGGREHLYISSIIIAASLITIYISDAYSENLCAATFDPQNPQDIIRFFHDNGSVAGILVTEATRLTRFNSWKVGTHTFERAATEFAASCAIPTPEYGVRAITTADGGVFTRDVWIIGDFGVVLQPDSNVLTWIRGIQVDVIGDPYSKRRLCDEVNLFEPPVFLQTINRCGPDENGNFELQANDDISPDTIMRIFTTDPGVLRIEAVGKTVKG